MASRLEAIALSLEAIASRSFNYDLDMQSDGSKNLCTPKMKTPRPFGPT